MRANNIEHLIKDDCCDVTQVENRINWRRL